MQPFSPSRFKFARQRRGFTKTQLAGDLEMSLRIVTAYERGEASPSVEVLGKLAHLLDVPVEFFSGDPLEAVDPASPSFRKYASLTARQRDSVLAAAELAWRFGQMIAEYFDLPDPDVPDMRNEDPEAAAAAVRAAWGLGNRPIKNLVHLLESRGIRVFSLCEDCSAVDAFCMWRDSTPVVYLNLGKSGERSRFDAAHELGHLVLHRHRDNRGKEAEEQAHRFASAFLMPRESVIANAPRIPSLDQVVALKRVWGVSPGALARRLYELNLMTEWQYRQACVGIARRGWRVSEPNPIERERSAVFAKVLPLLHAEGITLSALARRFPVHPRELAQFTFGLAPVAVDGGMASSGKKRRRVARRMLHLVPDST